MAIDNETARDVFETYSSYVFRTALFLTGSESLADDITQDTFIRVFRSYESYNPNQPLKPWIYKIALNVTKDVMKRQKSQLTVPYNFELLTDDTQTGNGLLREENRLELFKALNTLSRKSKEVIVLRYFNDMSLREMAESLNIPVGTCKSRLNEAVRHLRRSLSELMIEPVEGGGIDEKS